MNNLPENSILLVDGLHGIYVPYQFALMEFENDPQGVTHEHWETLSLGPDTTDAYWDTWDHVLDNAVLIGEDGTRYTLYQDGDLWAIPEGAEWPDDDFSTPNDYPYGEFGADTTHDRY